MYSLVLLVTILTPSPEFSAFLLDYNTISYSCRVRVVDTWTISHPVAQINHEELLMGAEIAQPLVACEGPKIMLHWCVLTTSDSPPL